MAATKNLTDEQFTKLECDSYAFLKASKFVAEYIKQREADPMSTVHNSMTTVMFTNLGMAFELKLKALYFKTTGKTVRGHVLAELFDKLPEHIRSDLQLIFENGPVYELKAYKNAKEPPERPSSSPKEGFRGLLAYLDENGMYNRRYSFETFSSHEWSTEIEPESLFILYSKITEFSNRIPKSNSSA